jgi:CubicO group peptidase (beta-lactamase class C family)
MRVPAPLPAALALTLGPYIVGCGAEGPEPAERFSATVLVPGEPALSLGEFEAILDGHRASLNIPGMAAAIVKGQQSVWARGFGYASVGKRIPATADTPFHLASLTKTFASTVIMQLVEAGWLDLEAPVSNFGIDLQSPGWRAPRPGLSALSCPSHSRPSRSRSRSPTATVRNVRWPCLTLRPGTS